MKIAGAISGVIALALPGSGTALLHGQQPGAAAPE